MRCKPLILLLACAMFGGAFGQSAPAKPGPPEAKIQDVATMEAILHTLYDVISGPPDQKRDWDRFRTLFVPSARLGAAVKIGDGSVHYFGLDVERYIALNDKAMGAKGFFEREIHRHVDTFGNMSQVFSTFESRYKPEDANPFERGINSIQLIDDGKRWWIVSVFWQSEDAQLTLPRMWVRG